MTISVKEQFEQWKQEAQNTLSKLKAEADAVIQPIQRDLELNTIQQIPTNFGKFLYSCLGERVVGQRSSVLNMTFFNNSDKGKRAVEQATEKKCTLEEYLSTYDCREDFRGIKSFNETQAYITAGRRFGVSYVTGRGERSHTIYFEEGQIFEFLTQEHVDCIKNSLKKECAQAFLDYRNSFVHDLNELNINNIVEINVPLKLASVVALSTTNKYRTDNYNTDRNSTQVIEEIVDDIATHATICTPVFNVWDKIKDVNSHAARYYTSEMGICLSIQFGKLTGKESPNYPVATLLLGNIDIGFGAFRHSADTLTDATNSIAVTIEGTRNFDSFAQLINKGKKADSYTLRTIEKISNRLPLNIGDIIKYPALQTEVQKRVTFFKDKSKELQELKHKFAGIYFLNAD